jgi:hypothetical protein
MDPTMQDPTTSVKESSGPEEVILQPHAFQCPQSEFSISDYIEHYHPDIDLLHHPDALLYALSQRLELIQSQRDKYILQQRHAIRCFPQNIMAIQEVYTRKLEAIDGVIKRNTVSLCSFDFNIDILYLFLHSL